MKKLMVVALVAFAAVCANAATVNWTISAIPALPDGTKASTAMKAYWLDGSNWEAFSQLSADKVAAYARANGTVGTTASNARGTSAAGSYGNYGAKDPVSGFFVVLSTDANDAKYYASAKELYTGTIPDNGGNLAPSFVFSTASTGWTATAVPEPTSGLLMLLGMAGLALRRRRA